MIKVNLNGVPLGAIATIEIHPEPVRFTGHIPKLTPGFYANGALTEADVSKLYADFLSQWPEVAAWYKKR